MLTLVPTPDPLAHLPPFSPPYSPGARDRHYLEVIGYLHRGLPDKYLDGFEDGLWLDCNDLWGDILDLICSHYELGLPVEETCVMAAEMTTKYCVARGIGEPNVVQFPEERR
jgi:hypothetical protein